MPWHVQRGLSDAVRFSERVWVALWWFEILWDTQGFSEWIWDALKGHWDALRCCKMLWDILRRSETFLKVLWSFLIFWEDLRHSETLRGISESVRASQMCLWCVSDPLRVFQSMTDYIILSMTSQSLSERELKVSQTNSEGLSLLEFFKVSESISRLTPKGL